MSNFVTGANAPGYHVVNANYPRDFAVTRLADIAAPYEGATCARCGGSLHSEAAIEVGRTARTGARLTGPAGAAYLDAHGQQHPVGLDVLSVKLDRLLAAIVEVHHDDYGIVWPRQVAPYAVHLVALARSPDEAATQAADALYADLQAAGLDVLYDDRLLSPGVMFSDADLIGAPLRVTVSARSLEAGGVEIKWRHEKERAILLREEAAQRIAALVG
jgi:prolyl-tRNA synthetase